MQQKVKVLSTEGELSRVMHIRESACSGDCHKCAGCGAAKQAMIFEARNPIGAKAGEVVIVESDSGPVLKAAAVLYMLPLVLFIAGYLLGMPRGLGGLTGGLAFALSIAIIVAYDRLVMKKKKTEYTITGYAHQGHQP